MISRKYVRLTNKMKVVAIPPEKCYIINACMKYIEGVNTT